MMSPGRLGRYCSLLGLLGPVALGVVGCGGDEVADSSPKVESASSPDGLSSDFVKNAWVVQLATNESLGPYLSNPGWATYVMKRDYRGAVQQFASSGGQPLARVHEDVASLYRQAALLSAHAFVETYGKMPAESDPVGTSHLLAVSYAILGDIEAAKSASAELLQSSDDPTLAWHKPWADWLAAGGEWPPDLSALPVSLGEPTPGGWPGIGELPHYQLPERTEEQRLRDMGDPGMIVAIALWHSAAARVAAPAEASNLSTYAARYRLPVERLKKADTATLPNEYLFGSDYGFSGDAAFVNRAEDASVKPRKPSEIATDGSGLEAMVFLGLKEGVLDSGLFADAASEYRDQLVAQATSAAGGTVQGFHRTFADMARVGALRVAAEFAESRQDKETSGKLRILAMEAEGSMETSNSDYVSCPVGMLSLAAWDAGNRYPSRGQEIIHRLSKRYEGLEAARYALDVLALRVSRSGAGDSVGM